MALPTSQTAVQLVGGFGFENVKVVTDAPVPQPGAGEVLVRLLLRPVNPADVFALLGVYPGYQPRAFPTTLGMEGMGVVAALGADVAPGAVNGVDVGKRVTAIHWPGFKFDGKGLWQEFVAVPADALTVVPDAVSDADAACAVVNPVTVVGMLHEVGDVPPGGKLLITAAGSALGKMVMGVAKERGIGTIGVVRRRAQADELLELGATHVIVSGEEDVEARVAELTGGSGAFAALDCLAGDSVAQLCRSVRLHGKVLVYGAMNGIDFKLSVVETLFRGVTVQGFWVALYIDAMTPEQRQEIMGEVFGLFSRGVISSGTATTLPLTEVGEALRQHNEAGRPGKLLLSSKAE